MGAHGHGIIDILKLEPRCIGTKGYANEEAYMAIIPHRLDIAHEGHEETYQDT